MIAKLHRTRFTFHPDFQQGIKFTSILLPHKLHRRSATLLNGKHAALLTERQESHYCIVGVYLYVYFLHSAFSLCNSNAHCIRFLLCCFELKINRNCGWLRPSFIFCSCAYGVCVCVCVQNVQQEHQSATFF